MLTMRPDARNEVLGALREIHDGHWSRPLGTDGGRILHWRGKMGLLFGVTPVFDQHYAVIGTMGDRFALCRFTLAPKGQFKAALRHTGAAAKIMREELAAAVAGLFVNELPEPRPLSEPEFAHLDRTVDLVVRLRGQVERDRYSKTKEIEAVPGAEGPARLGLMLERLLAGLDTLRVERTKALEVVQRIAYDSVPPQRLRIYRYLRKHGAQKTRSVALALGLPTSTIRRRLEELAAYGVVRREAEGDEAKGHDIWISGEWGHPPPPRRQ
jgi:hypothetical protein